MKYTSSEAGKVVNKLNNEISIINSLEYQSRSFTATLEENIESVRPAYDYSETQKRLAELEAQVRKVKHTINMFNLTHTVPGFDMTVDQALIYIPQLAAKIQKLEDMSKRLPIIRERSGMGANNIIVEYNYANYDVEQAALDCARAKDELARLHLALDLLNSTETLEIEL